MGNHGVGSVKRAVVLSGGGAYAAYEVGVMKALFHGASPATAGIPLESDIFSGTSAGSFNATMMISKPGVPSVTRVQNLENTWLDEIADNPKRCGNGIFRFRGDVLRFFDPTCLEANPTSPFAQIAEDSVFLARDWFQRALTFATSSESPARRTLELIDLATFVSTEQFNGTLQRVINLSDVRTSDKVLFVAATDFEDGQLKLFTNSDMSDQWGRPIIMASSAIPGFFPPIEINGRLYVDGGVLMNTPLSPAINAGADILHVTYLDPDIKNIPLARLNNTYDVFERALIVKMADTFNRDVENALQINQGLDLLQKAQRGELFSEKDLQVLIRVVSKLRERLTQQFPYRQLTIHRYHPKADLGGALGLLDFGRDRTARLIQLGFSDAVNHNCAESLCVLPN
jgi:NTE family protein